MSFPGERRTCMTGMLGTIVHDIQFHGRQGIGQSRPNPLQTRLHLDSIS
jgi:hypothetical protein